ncbi:beta-N-acetylglucosaminidase [Gelidibacter maritimus]|uniref:Beta-N-acetylglucosaminidase domain-containing protein n=1 Tax=Gelidibacter maritimus TaxID=2761487 RepID=A0A7W2R4M5_9FLAO|nr:beta-N-acetylglucosaminidase [Gelidibacter maritimus]MBA6153250.1 beta-N-acetylglucosaminidase domain-containing protein [Gelidibacter maritimus]
MKLLLSGLFFLTTCFGIAQDLAINPTPQQSVISNYIDTPTQFKLKIKTVDKTTQNLLSNFFDEEIIGRKGYTVTVGDVNDRFHRKFLKKVPQHAEGYFINSSNKKITVIGRDARGTYYGVRTLLALLSSDKFPQGEIIDYPDVVARGVVEGFYGTPWSFEHRMRQIDFYGENKLNTYIYGPKDDPYHSSPNWRKPYPSEEADQLKKLIDRAELNHVDFVWAIHPRKDIKWNNDDRNALLHKFELMYDLGVRSYAIFFDDISGEGTNPTQQAELLNFLHNRFITVKKDVKPLIMCPTEYNKGWSKPDGGYLETLGKELDPSIRIMWTGNTVVSDIDQETMDWINAKIQREAFIWWNFPVSDYVRNHLLLGPTYGNGKDIADDVSGFVANPMEHAEASKIAIYGVADYTWNMAAYQPEKNWLKALNVVMPESHKALEIFASHNSDLGPNGHKYRRNESVNFAPKADAFLRDLEANQNIENFETVQKEFQAMVEASYILLNSKDNPVLLDEIRPWVKQFQLLGQSGLAMLNMYTALQDKQTDAFERSYQALKAIKAKMYAIDRTENQNPYQPGIKTGTLVVSPLIDKGFLYLTKAYNQAFDKHLEVDANYNPHLLFTNIEQLKNQPITLRDRTLALNPPLEVISIAPHEYIGFELLDDTHAHKIAYKLAPAKVYEHLTLEVSSNGTEWTSLKTEVKEDVVKASVNSEVKFIRIINTSAGIEETKLEHFTVALK